MSFPDRRNQFDSHRRRRYTLQPPIHLTNDQQQTNSLINPSTSYKVHHPQDYFVSTSPKYSSNNVNSRLTSSRNAPIDDPWVNELLRREIDFSKLDHLPPKIEILNLNNNYQPISSNQNNFNGRLRNSSGNDFIRQDKFHRIDQYPSISTSQLNPPSRKWIIQPSSNNSNDFHRNKTKINSPKYKTILDEEESLIQQQKHSFHHQPNKTNEEESEVDHGTNGSKNVWKLYSVKEKRNILIYMFGLMLYKFGLEAFNGSIVSLATNRYDRDSFQSGGSSRTFESVGLLVGLNQACQCVGSILIAPLIKRWPTRTVLSLSIFLFALLTALLMIIDAATGGKIKPTNFYPMFEHDYRYYGNYPTSLIIPIYCLTGIAYGMVEIIRRIIPRDIVGSDEEKLKRMDAIVHVFYEMAGVSGALTTGLVLIPRLGNNYAFIITPILFTLAFIVWFFINSHQGKTDDDDGEIPSANIDEKTNYFQAIIKGFLLFGQSVYLGGKIIFTNRKYVWLFPCYCLQLYVHKYIENGIAPQIAKRYLNNSEWSQIIVGGSNFGELLGALAVFFLSRKILSPIIWLRFDCLLLFICWYIPFYNPSSVSITNAWIIAVSFIPFGFGGAGNDVCITAHIQSVLSKPELKNENVSSLGAVMAFLYSSYIIIYAILNPLLGKYIDSVYNSQQTIRPALIYTVGVQITIISIIIAASTFIPRRSFKLNPSLK